jgi:hypothetical protein
MKPINGWTKQGIIDHIRNNFKGKSVSGPDKVCCYRGDNGAKCAVGMFIPDDKYSKSMENTVVSSLLKLHPTLASSMPLKLLGMSTLQGIHDYEHENNILECMVKWIQTNVEEV